MIKSKTHKLLIALILVCTCGVILSAEPNEAKTEVKFEMKSFQEARMLLRLNMQPPYGSTHYAVLFVRGDWKYYRNRAPIESVLETSAGRAMSQQQRDIISNQSIKWRDYGATISNYTYFQLFGISEDDTKKMVEAFMVVAINRANANVQIFEKMRTEAKEKIRVINKELPEKQKQLKAAELKYKEIKNTRYFLFDDEQAYEKARETMLQMYKMLDVLEIELAGIQGKLKSLESYRRTKRLPRKELSDETVDKLDQMFVEQMVELRGVEARKKAALGIRNREKGFFDLFSQWSNLDSEVGPLQRDLKFSKNSLREAEKKLTNPVPEMLPPKIYQNKVTIYPVK